MIRPVFNASVFTFVECEWLIAPTESSFDDNTCTAQALYAFEIDPNTEIFTFTLEVDRYVSVSEVYAEIILDDYSLTSIPKSVNIERCTHESTSLSEIAGGYHIFTCDVCGEIAAMTPHEYDGYSDAVCDICGEWRVEQGDLNGDGFVDSDDAIYLLLYTFYQDEYPLNQGADFDGNGVVNSDDAIYLLQYTFYPEDYPLNV